MRDLQNDIDELSAMSRELNPETLKELRGESGGYVERLTRVAERTFARGDLLGGTTVQNPSFLVENKKRRYEKVFPDKIFAMYVRNIELRNGYFVAFPLRTIGVSINNVPVVEPPLNKDNYTVAYLPKSQNQHEIYIPSDMSVEFMFNVDSSDSVTINGLNPVTPAEFAIFDSVVCEFEHRSLQ
jgi:hypothetical protein